MMGYVDPTLQTCVPPTSFPAPPNGGMQYINYVLPAGSYHTVATEFAFKSSVTGTEETYLQLWDANIEASGQYFGVQTDATFGGGTAADQMLIFSKFIPGGENRWGEAQEVRAYGSSTVTLDEELGAPFVSLRRVVDLIRHRFYAVRVQRAESQSLTLDGVSRVGDWFDYYFDDECIGGIWFQRASAGVASKFNLTGGTWTEYWANNGGTLYPVPEQRFFVKPLKFNGSYPYATVTSVYSAMPNSDTAYIPATTSHGGYFDLKLGGDTNRCHIANASIDVTTTVARTLNFAIPLTCAGGIAGWEPDYSAGQLVFVDNGNYTIPNYAVRFTEGAALELHLPNLVGDDVEVVNGTIAYPKVERKRTARIACQLLFGTDPAGVAFADLQEGMLMNLQELNDLSDDTVTDSQGLQEIEYTPFIGANPISFDAHVMPIVPGSVQLGVGMAFGIILEVPDPSTIVVN